MRKRVVKEVAPGVAPAAGTWIDLSQIATVEVTSEDPAFPIESALVANSAAGWRAAEAGQQTVRLLFDEPTPLSRVRLVFEETAAERTQQFTLRVSTDGGRSYREVVRQQFNFSPGGSTLEVESYTINAKDATAVELTIVPDISGGSALASLRSMLFE